MGEGVGVGVGVGEEVTLGAAVAVAVGVGGGGIVGVAGGVGSMGCTKIILLVPVRALLASVAVIVCSATMCRVAEKVPVPPSRVLSTGNSAVMSLLVKWTVPA